MFLVINFSQKKSEDLFEKNEVLKNYQENVTEDLTKRDKDTVFELVFIYLGKNVKQDDYFNTKGKANQKTIVTFKENVYFLYLGIFRVDFTH